MLVEIGSVKSKWRLYDQGGVHVKSGDFLDKKGKYGRQKLSAVMNIVYRDF